LSDAGYILIDREIWDHDIFEVEPFTERLAWMWMISSAAWQDKRVRVGRKPYTLQRGQLVFSIRFLAEKWIWSKSKVHRFLARLQSEQMIELKTDHEATHITICNYNKYQLGRDTQRDTGGTLVGHSRDKEKEINTLRKEDVVVERSSGALVTPEALQLTEKLLVIAGHSPSAWPPGWGTAALRVQTWLNEKWPTEIIIAKAKAMMARNHDPPQTVQFFERGIAAEIAKQSAPLPKVEFRDQETITVEHGRVQATENLSMVARRLAANGIAFGERPSITGLRREEGSPDVRLLSQGRSERPGDIRSGNSSSPERISATGDRLHHGSEDGPADHIEVAAKRL